MSSLRYGFIALGGLALGFAAGWQLHQPRATARAIPPAGASGGAGTTAAFPLEGGRVYTDLLDQIPSILGPDRYALFDEVSGANLDNAFDGFRLPRSRYDVILEATQGGKPNYKTTSFYV